MAILPLHLEKYELEILKQEVVENLCKENRALRKELNLYKTYCARPVILKKTISHPARPRDSYNLYGTQAWTEYIYE